MKNHTDEVRSARPASNGQGQRASAKEEKLARALRRNLARRKQAVHEDAGAGAGKNG